MIFDNIINRNRDGGFFFNINIRYLYDLEISKFYLYIENYYNFFSIGL